MSGLIEFANRGLNTLSSGLEAGGPLRGQVGFERWFFHYHDKLSPEQIKKDPSVLGFSRLWAVASLIESFAKAFIARLSAFYYECMENKPEAEKRMDVFHEQDNSLYYSLFAIYSPEEAATDFSVRRGNPAQTATRTTWLFGISLHKHSWGDTYTGETTLKMLINTH